MCNMEQYDEEMGGSTRLPFVFNVEEYVTGHIEELNALTNAIENPSKTKLAFQRLPKHMRRRVMSHNVKRMPRRLREAHGKYLEKQNLKASKRPSRKYRRRPRNLLAEYNRRQRRHVWLETHIWHAKRFAMRPLWGYKLAERANEKSYRACERALERHCLLQDISYLVCIELSGPQSCLLEGLSQHFSRSTGFSPGAKFYLSGCKEGHAMFYEKNRFPFGAVGRVRFLWKQSEHPAEPRHVWIWSHPSYYATVLSELRATFDLESETQSVEVATDNDCSNTEESMEVSRASPSTETTRKRKVRNNAAVERTKLAPKNIARCQVPAYTHAQSGVRMEVLKDVLNRFELRGPLSGAVLARALHLYGETEEDSGPLATPLSIPTSLSSSIPSCRDELSPVWKLLQSSSPSQFPPRSVLGAIIRDPRFNMPAQRTRNELDTASDEDIVTLASLPPNLCRSPLWDAQIRLWCATNKLSTHEVNQILSTRLVPGVPCPRELSYASPLPLLCVQQEGAHRSELKTTGYGSGWDLIFPAGWSMPLLLALIFNGARVGGLREALNLSTRMQCEPPLAVDTQAWAQYEAGQTREARETYFRKPPKNRPNFIRLGVPSPFSFPWTLLLSDWNPSQQKSIEPQRTEPRPSESMDVDEAGPTSEPLKQQPTNGRHQEKRNTGGRESTNYYVLRDRQLIETLNNCIRRMHTPSGHTLNNRNRRMHTASGQTEWDQAETLLRSVAHGSDCLLQVNVQMCKRGTMDKYAHICLPTEAELDLLRPEKGLLLGKHKVEHTGQVCKGLLKDKTNESSHKRGKQRQRQSSGNATKIRDLDDVNQLKEYFEREQIGHTIREPPHGDPNRSVRKYLRAQHRALLARLRRRRVRAKKRGPNAFEKPGRVKRKAAPTEEVVETYKEIMERLWVPDVICSGGDGMRVEDATHDEANGDVDSPGSKRASYLNNLKRIPVDKREGCSERRDEVETDNPRVSSSQVARTSVDNDGKSCTQVDSAGSGSSSKTAMHKPVDGSDLKHKRSRKKSEKRVENKRRMKNRQGMDESGEEDAADSLMEVPSDMEITDPISPVTSMNQRSISGLSPLIADSEVGNDEPISTDSSTSRTDHYKSAKIKDDVTKHSITSGSNDFSPRDVMARLQPIRSLRYHASHELLGFVTSRSFHATAHCGQGCVTLNGFIDLMRRVEKCRMNQTLVLVRETNHVNYHWARISLI